MKVASSLLSRADYSASYDGADDNRSNSYNVRTEAEAAASTQYLKHWLKEWETRFQATHGRVPTKKDLSHNQAVANKYREYSKLKRVAQRRAVNSAIARAEIKSDKQGKERSLQRLSAENNAILPLETSILAMSLKRKAMDRQINATPPMAPAQTTQGLHDTHSGVTSNGKPAIVSLVANEEKNAPADTPKRMRTVYRLEQQTISEDFDLSACLTADYEAFDAGTSEIDIASYVECEAVLYTPPPSLIRQYNQQSSTAQTSTRVLCNPYTSVSDDRDSSDVNTALEQPKAPVVKKSARTIDLSAKTTMTKAKAGQLVKTTSIPLSIFNTGSQGLSQLDLSQNGYLSGGDDVTQRIYSTSKGQADLEDSELVFGSENDERISGPGADDGPLKKAKKATQKRSTRRVKLRPVGKDGMTNGSMRTARARDGNHLVSSNFYKLKLKGGRRGPKSAEERRSAMYKRMLGKKGLTGKGGVTQGGECQVRGATDCTIATERAESDYDDGVFSSHNSPGDSCEYTSTFRREILGQPLDYFGTDESSVASEMCTLSLISTAESNRTSNSDVVLDLRKVLKHVWGYDFFRSGQAEAMRRVIEGKSTLLSLATGAGKSLVYQLPSIVLAATHHGFTLVITPLLSLMRDQVRHLPAGMQALCMSSDASSHNGYDDTAARLASGQAQLLFVSPERLQSPRFQQMLAADGMPRVSLAVIDEAHCADEWSHNFRSAYLQLPQHLRKLNVACVLAMTGTATAALSERLCKMFAIDTTHGIVRGNALRKNIELSVVPVDMGAAPFTRSTAREDALVSVLRSQDLAQLDSILIYVSTQANADRVAEYLTVRSIPAQSYHAGKPAAERTRIQAAFMQAPSGNSIERGIGLNGVPIRILVATVAFGMGLNKSDVRAVIHFNIPRSMEAYVQEVGRAGRDGAPARGVLLLAMYPTQNNPQQHPAYIKCASADAVLLRSWAHAAGIDMVSIRRLLHRLFPADFIRSAIVSARKACANAATITSSSWRAMHTAVMSLKELEADLDVDQATAQTLINYLALMEPTMIQMEPNAHRKCTVRFTRTDLGKLANSSRLFAAIAASFTDGMARMHQPRPNGILTHIPSVQKPTNNVDVDVFELARRMGVKPSETITELYQWRAKREVALEWQDPSCVVRIALDMSQFVDQESGSSDAKHWADQLALRLDDYITGLATSLSQHNETRVRDNLNRVRSIESMALAACEAARRVEQLLQAQVASKSAQAAQNDILQTSIAAYFAATSEEEEDAVLCLKERMDALGMDVLDTSMIPTSFYRQSVDADGDAVSIASEVRKCVSNFVQQHADRLKSARAVARIFHGLSSPSFTSSQWSWCSEWGSLVGTDFEIVRRCAQEELVRMRCSLSEACQRSD